MEKTRNVKLVLEYDGTNYHGWQAQTGSGKPTIQETLENAVAALAHQEVTIYSSGRTDAGVHAFGHVANFNCTSTIPPEAWAPALNHLLPPDIRVLASSQVPEDFHARYSAVSKTYKYRILNRKASSALFRNYAWHLNLPLEVEAMKSAAVCLPGKRDFSAFRSSSCTAKSPVRTLKRVEISTSGHFIDVWLEADAFLQYMVRNIVGTLVEVGLSRFTPHNVAEILQSCDRTRAGRTAPAHGLYLMDVSY